MTHVTRFLTISYKLHLAVGKDNKWDDITEISLNIEIHNTNYCYIVILKFEWADFLSKIESKNVGRIWQTVQILIRLLNELYDQGLHILLRHHCPIRYANVSRFQYFICHSDLQCCE